MEQGKQLRAIELGTIYSIACKDCKVVRNLDKFRGAREIKTRDEALEYAKELTEHKGWAFRSGLLVSFMAEHMGHDCVFFNEHSSCEEELDPYYDDNEYKEDINYWKTSEGPSKDETESI